VTARHSDPWTSHAAAISIRQTAKSQREAILAAYADYPNGLTDEEAASIAGAKGCWWKRCSELRAEGLIVDTGYVRNGSAGRARIVCAVPIPATLFH
jgi:hypothetical protein